MINKIKMAKILTINKDYSIYSFSLLVYLDYFMLKNICKKLKVCLNRKLNLIFISKFVRKKKLYNPLIMKRQLKMIRVFIRI